MNTVIHPTSIFLANPQALRVEFNLDRQCLMVWWSPKAGLSNDCLDRNYSSRDSQLEVFAEIHLPDCRLADFSSCDYDPYHCQIHFSKHCLHLAVSVDAPALMLWCDEKQQVVFKSDRFDRALRQDAGIFAVAQGQPRYTFEFAAVLASGEGSFRHPHFHLEEQAYFAEATMVPGQALVIAVDIEGQEIIARAQALAAGGPGELLARNEAVLAPHEAAGAIHSPGYPQLAELRRMTIRGLHSMIDESGAVRASLKAIYYLIWVRDGGFAFPYQADAGWPHKLKEFCRLLLDNPTTVSDPGLPNQRMFAQLINRRLGRLEEDGLYYVVRSLFAYWTQIGELDFVKQADWELIDEALSWLEEVTWDQERGLYGEFTADETPAHGHRDQGWDYAIAKPVGAFCITYGGQPVKRNYDVYYNLCMHSTYIMLAAMRQQPDLASKAERLWPELKKMLVTRPNGLPIYGELALADGRREQIDLLALASAQGCAVWGLCLANFAPLADWDEVRCRLMDQLQAKGGMHFVNGICAAMAAVDTWLYPEEKLLAHHQELARQTFSSGSYLPMPGAMPEKFNAPQGDLHHDIRPQAFAMGAWLASWTALGLRRLPYGLALRPTQAFEQISDYPWRQALLDCRFGPQGHDLALEIDGRIVNGTLQIPECHVKEGRHQVNLIQAAPTLLWLRSSVRLERVEESADQRIYHFTAFGPSEICFSQRPPAWNLELADEPTATWHQDGMAKLLFQAWGQGCLIIENSSLAE